MQTYEMHSGEHLSIKKLTKIQCRFCNGGQRLYVLTSVHQLSVPLRAACLEIWNLISIRQEGVNAPLSAQKMDKLGSKLPSFELMSTETDREV